jgi:hypothetical protein
MDISCTLQALVDRAGDVNRGDPGPWVVRDL